VSKGADQLPTDVAARQASLLWRVRSMMRRLPSGTKRWRKITACSTCCINCSACSLAAGHQDQLQLAFEDVEQAVAVTEAADDKHDPVGARECAEKCRANRGALPAHLPRIHVMIAPEDTNRACCRSPMHVIGEDVAERLDVIPGPVPGDRDAPVRLPGMRGGSGAGSCARAADQGRTSAASHAADGDHRLGWCLPFHVSSSASASLIGAEALWRK
jgi:hypothetical protein